MRWCRRVVGLVVVAVLVASVLGPGAGAVGAASDVPFSDLDAAGVHRSAVEGLAARGVFVGTECGPGEFCPRDAVERWVMAVWLVRILDGSDSVGDGSSRFVDVDGSEWWAPYVERLADLGVTDGCATEPARFCPYGTVTRAEMASFLVRAFGLPPASSAGFADVGDGVHTANIDALADSGVTSGCRKEPLWYCPRRDTTRAEMATFLTRALAFDRELSGERFVEVAAGGFHSCGIRTDGTVVCWGANWEGQADPPQGEFTVLSSGWDHSCGIRTDGAVACWGSRFSRAGVPEGTFVSVSAGRYYTCGIRTDGTVVCWGANRNGQADPPDGEFTDVAASVVHSCGIRTDGAVVCWGANRNGQADPPEGHFTDVAAGNAHTCGLRTDARVECWGLIDPPEGRFSTVSGTSGHMCGLGTDGAVVCWGANEEGQADPPDGRFTAVSAGNSHSCGVRGGGSVVCWGIDWSGEPEPPDGVFVASSVGNLHACGLRLDGTVACWGSNGSGQATPPAGTFSAVAAGGSHACGLRLDGTVACWGSNSLGQATPPTGRFASVSAGSGNSCGVRLDGTVACWGYNGSGQATPPAGTFSAVAAGGSHACGLRLDGTVACWGSNRSGEATPPTGRFTAVSAGGSHSCGLRLDGTVACWGYNGSGQATPPAGTFSAVAAGDRYSCGLRPDGAVVCWGNLVGQVQPPTGRFESVSVKKSGYTDAYSCGLRPDGAVVCWGRAPVVSVPASVRYAVWADAPDPGMCRPVGISGTTAGFPLPGWAATSTGLLRVPVVFVEFPDKEATHTTHDEAALGLPYAEEYLEAASYGKLDVAFNPLHRWLRPEHNHDRYIGGGTTDPESYVVDEAARLADPYLDFAGYDIMMVVMPGSHFWSAIAGLSAVRTDEGTIQNITMINLRPRPEPGKPTSWGHTAAHELTHNLGLLDLYPTSDHKLPNPPEGQKWVTTRFGLMGLQARFLTRDSAPYSTYTGGSEMLAWSRWQLGWLEPTQIRCVTGTEATVTLSPVADPGTGTAMAAIPISRHKAIVVESRHKLGYDTALATEGVLVYTVDAAVGTRRLPLRIAGDTGNAQVDDYPILTQGQSVTIGGYTITVQSVTANGDTITITKNKA